MFTGRFREDPTLSSSKATVVCLSVCGNFVLVRYDSGHVHRFNVQSGIHRGTYSAVKVGFAASVFMRVSLRSLTL